MSKRLILNGKVVPLPAETKIAITYQARDIRNVATHDGAYAETITLPFTHAIQRALENSDLLTSTTKTPYRLLPVAIEQDYNSVLTGVAGHTEVNEGFVLDINGNNADFFNELKGKNLTDLDLSDLDHVWDNDTVGNSNSHDPARGFIYPLINYGKLTDRYLAKGNVRFDELYPAVYASTLLERMAEGYTLAGSLLNDLRFQRLIVPFTNDYFVYRESYRAERDTKAVSTVAVQYLPGSSALQLDTVVYDPLGLLNATEQYVVPQLGNYQVKVSFIIDVNFTGIAATDFLIRVIRAAGGVEVWHTTSLQKGHNQKVEVDITLLNLRPGDVIAFSIFPPTTTFNTFIKAGASVEVKLQNVVFPENPVHLEANLPDISQEDMVLTILNMFNVLVQTDPIRKIVRLDLLEDLKLKQPVDWSNKIDWTKRPRINYDFGDYAKNNYIGYEPIEEKDSTGNDIQDIANLPIDNDRLELSADLYISPFASTVNWISFQGRLPLPYIPLFKQDVLSFWHWSPTRTFQTEDWVFWNHDYWMAKRPNTNVPPSNATPDDWEKTGRERVFPSLSAKPRLLLVENMATPVYVGEDYQPGSTYPLYVTAAFEKSNGGGINAEAMVQNFHGVTKRMLDDTHILSVDVRLRLPDINQLDHLRPVMLNVPNKNLEGLFYLNKVSQFDPENNGSTEVELVRLYGLPLYTSGDAHKEYSSEYGSEYN